MSLMLAANSYSLKQRANKVLVGPAAVACYSLPGLSGHNVIEVQKELRVARLLQPTSCWEMSK